LPAEQEGLGIFASSTDLEGPEILVPIALGSLGLGLAPELKLVQILAGNFALTKSFEQVIAQSCRKVRLLNLWHLLTKGHAGKFFLDALPFIRVGGGYEPVCERKISVLLGLLGFQAGFNQLDKDPVGASLSVFGEDLHAFRDARRKGDALAE
jgi:hypothetical protein